MSSGSDDARETIQRFASDTRHRVSELDMNHVTRKFLAVQAPLVSDWTRVYRHVDNDLERLQFRSVPKRDPEHWNKHEEIPLAVYKQLLPPNEEALGARLARNGAYRDYCAHLATFTAAPIDTEQDGPLLFFLHGARNKNLRALLSEQYPTWTARDTESLYQHMIGYQLHRHDSERAVEEDVASIILHVPLPEAHTETVLLEDLPLPAAKVSEADVPLPQANTRAPMVLAPEPPAEHASEKHQQRLLNNAIFKQYARSASLPLHFDESKMVKQILVSLLLPNTADIAAPLMGTRQTQLGQVVLTTPDAWNQLLDKVVAPPGGLMDTLDQVRDFYDALRVSMPREDLEAMTRSDLLRHLITAHVPEPERAKIWPSASPATQRAVGAYLRKWPTLDPKLITAI